MKTRHPKHRATVVLIGGSLSGVDASIRQGLYSFLDSGRPWVVHDFARETDDLRQVHCAKTLAPSIVVAHVVFPAVAHALSRLRVPVINLSNVLRPRPFCYVGIDDVAVGRQAADYFLQRGYRSFGFFGHRSWAFTEDRLRGYRACLRTAGLDTSVYRPSYRAEGVDYAVLLANHAAWLRELPRPAAVLTDMDTNGRKLCIAAKQAGIRVPEDVAILGVDNQSLVCNLCYPQLSSIAPCGEEIGHEVGRLIDRVLDGGGLPREPVLFAPGGVITRRSTNAVATHDPNLSAALRFMHEHVSDGINVKEVLREVPISRIQLFRLFKTVVGRSPLAELQRLRCENAKRLLATTNLPILEIASRCGFRNYGYMGRLLHRAIGMTPRAFRQQHRTPAVPSHRDPKRPPLYGTRTRTR